MLGCGKGIYWGSRIVLDGFGGLVWVYRELVKLLYLLGAW